MTIKSSRDASATKKYISTRGGTASYASAAQLPFSGNNVGDRAVLTDTNKLYLWNGNGWFEMVTATSDLTITQHPEASYTLAQDGSSTEITLEATGTGTIEWGYYFNRPVNDAVTVTNVGNVFTVTPSIDFNKNGAYKITFYAKNATNVANITSTVVVNAPPVGQAEFITPGTYSWTAPEGVTSVSVVAVGGGGSGGADQNFAGGGGGGGLGWKNDIPVTPGQSYTVVVGAGGPTRIGPNTESMGSAYSGGNSYFINQSTVAGLGGHFGMKNYNIQGEAPGGGYVGDGGGHGGTGSRSYSGGPVGGHGGAGGAGGYTGNGGNGSDQHTYSGAKNGYAGAGGGGAGGAEVYVSGTNQVRHAGGGVGIYGQGNNGSVISSNGGGGGSGGENGTQSSSNATYHNGGKFGGGGGTTYYSGSNRSGAGGGGAVRIIWGPNRAFPSTNTADM